MDRDYVLGTHNEELARLGLQHRVWRPVVLDCWQRAGITVGKRILDVGAGPGYATVDLAEIVGATGEIVALRIAVDIDRVHPGAIAREREDPPTGFNDGRVAQRKLRFFLVPMGHVICE